MFACLHSNEAGLSCTPSSYLHPYYNKLSLTTHCPANVATFACLQLHSDAQSSRAFAHLHSHCPGDVALCFAYQQSHSNALSSRAFALTLSHCPGDVALCIACQQSHSNAQSFRAFTHLHSHSHTALAMKHYVLHVSNHTVMRSLPVHLRICTHTLTLPWQCSIMSCMSAITQ